MWVPISGQTGRNATSPEPKPGAGAKLQRSTAGPRFRHPIREDKNRNIKRSIRLGILPEAQNLQAQRGQTHNTRDYART